MISLPDVANADIKRLPREYMDENGTMINEAFRKYALPLIGDVPPIVRLRKDNLNRQNAENTEKIQE
jgi:hypothetical protein